MESSTFKWGLIWGLVAGVVMSVFRMVITPAQNQNSTHDSAEETITIEFNGTDDVLVDENSWFWVQGSSACAMTTSPSQRCTVRNGNNVKNMRWNNNCRAAYNACKKEHTGGKK